MNFSVDLSGEVALVTGAGAGIGRAIALASAQAGAAVGVNDLNPDRADNVAQEIVTAGGQAMPWSADISNKFQIAANIEALRDRFTHLNILVNAAGIQRASSLIADLQQVLQLAPAAAAQAPESVASDSSELSTPNYTPTE